VRVIDLQGLLAGLDPNATILVSSDEEGNSFHEATGYALGVMVTGSPGPIEYRDIDEDALRSSANCFVLYP
jgi:hypothetical protein